MIVQVWMRIYRRDPSTDSGELVRSGTLQIALEQAMSRLEQLPRMFIEPDGSFLWTGAQSNHALAQETRARDTQVRHAQNNGARTNGEIDCSGDASGADERHGSQWQLEGTVYDDGQEVRYIELRGQCPLARWQEFLAAFGQSLSSILLELLDEKRIVDGTWLRGHFPGSQFSNS